MELSYSNSWFTVNVSYTDDWMLSFTAHTDKFILAEKQIYLLIQIKSSCRKNMNSSKD